MTSTARLATFALTMLAIGSGPEVARACGGFFCNNSQPVNQTAERILFSQDADGTVTGIIQILYDGPSERFAWVLPVGGMPEIDVSSDLAFQRLQAATNPQYILATTVDGTCRDDRFRGAPSGSGALDAGASFADGGGGPGAPPVSVLDSGSVGPYDYVVITVDPELEDPAEVAVEWLQANDYDVDAMSAAALRPYLAAGLNLLSFRLTKGNDTGSIRPVRIRFGVGLPSIPIRPTAVAATDDMGVMVWLLGEERAVPVNYRSLELNEALIDWINPSRNYDDVVNAAADEAGGQGFVTEMAARTSTLGDVILQPWEETGFRNLRTQDWTGREGELLGNSLGQFGFWDGMRDAVAAHVPLPEGVTLDALLGCVSCYYRWDEADIEGFDPIAFLETMEEDVFEPMKATAELFASRPYMTRLYTTMSPSDMTMDPMFDFNGNLPEYSNVHNASRVIECSPSVDRASAPWRVTLPNGTTVRGRGTSWPFTVEGGEMPANLRILRIGGEGMGEVETDNTERVGALLRSHNRTVPSGFPLAGGGGGCSIGSGGATGALLALAGLALLALRRRR